MSKPRVLVIDDEPQIHRFLAHALEAAGYEHIRAETGEAGLALIATRPPDAVILDLGLPDMEGKAVLAQARHFFDGPLLVLSAREREMEKIEALDLGADDYVQKPFAVGELLARLRVAIRNRLVRQNVTPVVEAGDLKIDLVLRLVTRRGEIVKLSPREYEVLAGLVEAGSRVLTHRQLLTAVWGPAHSEDTQYIRVVVQRLRQKLEEDPARPRHLLTEAGVGYRFLI